MRPELADPGRLWHMLEAADAVVQFTAGKTMADFAGDRLLRSAGERQVGIIGEAASKRSRTLRDGNPQVPWDKIIRTRHVLVHDYDRVVVDTVWRIATEYVPPLVGQLRALLPPIPPDPEPDA